MWEPNASFPYKVEANCALCFLRFLRGSSCSMVSGGIGIIDIGFRTPSEAYATGGSGVIYQTKDGGKTWSFDPSAKDLPCNLYNVKFFQNGKVGYMVGSAGILLRRTFEV
eukprot:s4189_g4.t1